MKYEYKELVVISQSPLPEQMAHDVRERWRFVAWINDWRVPFGQIISIRTMLLERESLLG